MKNSWFLSDFTLERFLRVSNATAGAGGLLTWIGFANTVFTLLLPLMITHQTIQILQGNFPTLGENIRGDLQHTGRYLLNLLLLFLFFLGVVLVLAIPAVCLGPFGVILILPGMIFLGVRIAVYISALVNEHAGPMESLKRSWALTEGLFWRTFGFSLIVSVLSWVIMFLPAVITSIFIVSLPPGAEKMLATLDTVSSSLITAIILPFTNLASVLYYFDLLVRKEGYDLTLRVQQVEVEARDTKE